MAQLQSSQEGKHPVISLTTPSPTLGLYLPLKPQQYLSPIIPAFINTTAMLVSLLKGGASTLQWDLSVTVVVIFLSAFVLTQKLTSIQSYVARSQTGEAKSSPIVPFVIPSVGTLLSFDTKEFYTKMNSFRPNSAASFQILSQEVSFITGLTTSSPYSNPHASNDIGTHNRLFQIMHKTSNDNLARSASAELATSFMSNLEAELNL
ncbi:hypothetical protein F5882DRAFT_466619 [Hyaloscypha sp. PMI_1271]|nr:hypothetical protein F5882DRAFT_466619 [Hyaloscypha sp. PMI_1271]